MLNRCAYRHTDEKGDLEVITGGKTPVQVITLMLFCSLKNEYTECATSRRQMPINGLQIEEWWLPPKP